MRRPCARSGASGHALSPRNPSLSRYLLIPNFETTKAPNPALASILLPATPALLIPRQATTTVVQAPNAPSCSGQYSGGTLAGAILGTFFGTILIIYLFNSINNNQNRIGAQEVVVERKVRSNGSRRRRRSRSGGSASSVRRPSRVYSVHD